jgi:hypothetical protein
LQPKVHKVEVVNISEMQDNLQNSENADSASVLADATCNQIEKGGEPPTESAKNENLQPDTPPQIPQSIENGEGGILQPENTQENMQENESVHEQTETDREWNVLSENLCSNYESVDNIQRLNLH